MRTIVQDFPTIYGEAVNGSVFGQPNGSIARPPQNIAASIILSGTVVLTYTGLIGTTTAKYDLTGLGIAITVDSYARLILRVKDSSNNVIASGQINSSTPVPETWHSITGIVGNKPTDGDSVSVTVELVDSDARTIASHMITGTAEVPA